MGNTESPSDRASILAFMRDLPPRKVNGIGRVFERELDAIGVKTCGDIYAHRQSLRALFGDKAFEFLMSVYLGLGRTDVRPAEEFERKSVGTESTFHDMSDPQELRQKLRWIAEELEKDPGEDSIQRPNPGSEGQAAFVRGVHATVPAAQSRE